MATGEIRNELDIASINTFISRSVPLIQSPVTVKQFSSGQSNPTYLLTDKKGNGYVLRSKPVGQLMSSKAHAVEREYKVIHALQEYNGKLKPGQEALRVPVPHVYCLCEDSSIIGRPFYIMEFLKGRIFTDATLPEIEKADRAEYWLELVRTQAKLARIPLDELDLPPKFAPDAPFYSRTTPSMFKLAKVQAQAKDKETGEEVGMMPGYPEAMQWFRDTIPKEFEQRRLSHGDLKMDNVVFHPTKPIVIGILDWELCTIGAPIADFANSMLPYYAPDVAEKPGLGFEGLDKAETGLPDREELQKAWCQGMGISYPIKHIRWAMAWQFGRLAFIAQGIAARYARRQASNQRAKAYGEFRFRYADLMHRWIAEEKKINPR